MIDQTSKPKNKAKGSVSSMSLKATVFMLIAISIVYGAGLLNGRYLGSGWPFAVGATTNNTLKNANKNEKDHPSDDHEDHAGHDHSAHEEGNSIELSDSARKNLGLTKEYLLPIELSSFERSISVPAVVVDSPGRTRLPVSASMSGIVTHIHALTGEAVRPGDLLMEIRLTHEDLVTAQKEYLQSLGDREIESKEIARIEGVVSSGAVSTKTLLERQYSRDKIDSLLRSQREALRLHGITDAQIATIDEQRRLLTEMKVFAPDPDNHSASEIQLSRQSILQKSASIELKSQLRFDTSNSGIVVRNAGFSQEATPVGDADSQHLLVLQELRVQKGQVVNAGELLCTLADYKELLIEGQAFEAEANDIARAKTQGWKVAALVEDGGNLARVNDLSFRWVGNEIDPSTRALKFYVELPNKRLPDSVGSTGQRYITWQYRTGQRMQLLVPVEKWEDQIVLPVDAVIREGIECYVFQQNGSHFARVSVHERFRDQTSVVLENDGTLYPGDVVARRGAHQLQMALKNKSSGGVDPHAGHNH